MQAEPRNFCVILGGGGHARVLLEALRLMNAARRYVVLDRDPARWGHELDDVLVAGDDNLLPKLLGEGADGFVVGVGATGDNRPRERLFAFGCAQGLAPLTVVHPSVICSKYAMVGAGAQLLPACIINSGACIGRNVIINSGAIVEHDCIVEDHAHVASGARLASTVRVARGAHVGLGASVRQCITIGEFAIVGAGAVVVKDVPPRTVVVGVPARPMNRGQQR